MPVLWFLQHNWIDITSQRIYLWVCGSFNGKVDSGTVCHLFVHSCGECEGAVHGVSGWIRQLCKCFGGKGPTGGKEPLGRTGYRSIDVHFTKTNSLCVWVLDWLGLGVICCVCFSSCKVLIFYFAERLACVNESVNFVHWKCQRGIKMFRAKGQNVRNLEIGAKCWELRDRGKILRT